MNFYHQILLDGLSSRFMSAEGLWDFEDFLKQFLKTLENIWKMLQNAFIVILLNPRIHSEYGKGIFLDRPDELYWEIQIT